MMTELAQTLVLPNDKPTLELDELWSFVLKKVNKRWIWIALCRETRQVVAFVIGNRTAASCRQLWRAHSERISPRTLFFRLLESVSNSHSKRPPPGSGERNR